MSLSNTKILISGCGFSWGSQKLKTWVNVFKVAGIKFTDVGGPAVSNQWIIDAAFNALNRDKTFSHAVIQLTALGKLDVEINDHRIKHLVEPDPIRNFTINGVWPSSASNDHLSKKLYYEWLYSPSLEVNELYVKLMMLHTWCQVNNINLTVVQAYPISWSKEQQKDLSSFVMYMELPLYEQYKVSPYYKLHDFSNFNTVPCQSYQIYLAHQLAKPITPALNKDNIARIEKMLNTVNQSKQKTNK